MCVCGGGGGVGVGVGGRGGGGEGGFANLSAFFGCSTVKICQHGMIQFCSSVVSVSHNIVYSCQ